MNHYKLLFISAVALVAVMAFLASPDIAAARSTLKCRPADDTSLSIILQLKQWVTTQNPERISERDNIFHVPVVPANQITLVTNETICARVIRAYTEYQGYTPARLYVIKMGSSGYAGYDPDKHGGEFTAVSIFDSSYVHIGGWSG